MMRFKALTPRMLHADITLILLCTVYLLCCERGRSCRIGYPHWSTSDANGRLYLGLIRHGRPNFTEEVVAIQNCNVSVFTFTVDLQESFQVFSAAHLLTNDYHVDVVVALHDTSVNSRLEAASTLSETPVIDWGARPTFSAKYVSQPPLTDPTICSTLQTNNRTKSPFCYNDFQVRAILQDVNNRTQWKGRVPLLVPPILSTVIVEALQWRSVFIFYENSTEFDAGELVDMLSLERVKVVLFNVDLVHDLYKVIYRHYIQVVPVDSHVQFAVLCRPNCLRKLFSTVNQFDDINGPTKTLLKQFSRWLVAAYDHTEDVTETLRACADDMDNVAFVAFPEVSTRSNVREFKRTLFNLVSEVLINEALLQTEDNATLEEGSFKEKILSSLEEKALELAPGQQCAGLRMETLMWKSDGRYFDNVGFITKAGDVIVLSKIFPNANFGYNKRKFKVTTLHYDPFVKKYIENGTTRYGGICMDLLNELCRTLNFTYTITEPPDKKWGSPVDDDNLTFNGMIGQLQRQEVDIAAADLSIQKVREEVMDFMFPFFYGDTSVVLKKPDPNRRKWRTLLDPLKQDVLLYIGLLLPVASLLAFLLEKFNPYYSIPEHADYAKENYGLHTFHDSFWYMYGALLSQGGINLPESNAGRTFVSCWWLFSIVIVGTYCGNLIAFLTVTREKPPFNTLDEMAELKDEYKWGLQAGTHWEFVFKTSTRREFRRIGDIMLKFNESDPSILSTDVDVHLNRVKQGKYGWIGDTVIIEMEMAKTCDLMMIKERFLPLKYAFGFTNNSPHVQIFSKQMLSIHESGLLQVWKRRWWPKSEAICSGSIVTEAKAISIIDVQSAFYVAAGGAVLGFFAFLIEMCVARFRKHRRRNNGDQTSQNANEIQIIETSSCNGTANGQLRL